MRETLRGLFRHMSWADAEVWQAGRAARRVLDDTGVRERLYHIHLVQRAFLYLWLERTFEFPALAAFPEAGALAAWGREGHERIQAWLDEVEETAFGRAVPIPWAGRFSERLGRPPSAATLAETALQVALHSTYHRGQVNARLRELSVEPPLTDYIAWIWFGKPAAVWPGPDGPAAPSSA